jgi:hypothetical protein
MFGGVTSGTQYFIKDIIGTTISISTTSSGAAFALTAATGSNPMFLSSPDEYPGSNKENINDRSWFYHEYRHNWPPSSCTNCNSYFAQYRIETTSTGGPATSSLFVDEVRLSLREACASASSLVPSPVQHALTSGNAALISWTNVSLGWDHSCATDVTSTLYCWGRNQEGQVGDGSITDVSRPRAVLNLPASVVSFSLGRFHSCAVAAGALYCWGAFSTTSSTVNYGQAGATGSVVPVMIQGIFAAAVITVTCGKLHTCALDSAGDVWCFGRNHLGQLGIGSTVSTSNPTRIQNLPHPVASLATGMKGDSSCVITMQQQRWCWGENNFGQAGDGSTIGRYLPTSGVSALVRIEPSGIFSIRNGMQFLIYSAFSFGVSPYTVCKGVQLQASTNPSIAYDLTCSWLDPSIIEGAGVSGAPLLSFCVQVSNCTLSAQFYSPPGVVDSDYPSIAHIPEFNVVRNARNYFINS